MMPFLRIQLHPLVAVCLGLCISSHASGAAFLDYQVSLAKHTLRIYLNDAQGKPFSQFAALDRALDSRSEKLVFAMNGGIFMEDLRPLGLFIENGKVLRKLNTRQSGYGNFYMQPNGVFLIDENGAAILPTAQYPAHAKSRTVRFATQSGPMLVINKQMNPALPKASGSKLIRNAACVIDKGTVVLSLAEEPVTFQALAQHLQAIGCQDALYLDGAISDIYWPEQGRGGTGGAFGPIIGVSESRHLRK